VPPEIQGIALLTGPTRVPQGDIITFSGMQAGIFYALLTKSRDGGYKTNLLGLGWTQSEEETSWVFNGENQFMDILWIKNDGTDLVLPASQTDDAVVVFGWKEVVARPPCANWKIDHACEGEIIEDIALSEAECIAECVARSNCKCISWGVNPNAKCRLETGPDATYRGEASNGWKACESPDFRDGYVFHKNKYCDGYSYLGNTHVQVTLKEAQRRCNNDIACGGVAKWNCNDGDEQWNFCGYDGAGVFSIRNYGAGRCTYEKIRHV